MSEHKGYSKQNVLLNIHIHSTVSKYRHLYTFTSDFQAAETQSAQPKTGLPRKDNEVGKKP